MSVTSLHILCSCCINYDRAVVNIGGKFKLIPKTGLSLLPKIVQQMLYTYWCVLNFDLGGGAAPVAAAAPAGGAAAAAAPAVEEKKEEPKEESDDDMGFSLFD